MKILKFGGSSIGTSIRIKQVLNILNEYHLKKRKIIVVFSAVEGITDQLIEMGQKAAIGNKRYLDAYSKLENIHLQMANDLISSKILSETIKQLKTLLMELQEILHGIYLIKELTNKTLDFLMSFGERLSAYIISQCLKDRKIENEFIDSRKFIITDNNFGNSNIEYKISNKKIISLLSDKRFMIITTGFIGSTLNNETTTLGRGGSDFSASIIGAALNVSEIEIWTDVNGVLTADPKKVPTSFSITHMSYEEAMELSHFGAKVIHPPTMQPALNKKIPIRIKNTFNPSFKGTVISNKSVQNEFEICGISSIDSISLIQVQGSGMIGSTGIAGRIFSALSKRGISIILISQASSEHSICLGIRPEIAVFAKSAIEEELKYEIHYNLVDRVVLELNMSVIAIVGENMRKRKGIAGKIFQSLGKNDINISAIAQGSSELNITIVVKKEDEDKALNTIHDTFFNQKNTTLNLFVLCDDIKKNFIFEQLKELEKIFYEEFKISLNLILAADINSMILNYTPQIKMDKNQNEEQTYNSNKYIQFIIASNQKNKVFIDLSKNALKISLYKKLLDQKIFMLSTLENTKKLKKEKNIDNLFLTDSINTNYKLSDHSLNFLRISKRLNIGIFSLN